MDARTLTASAKSLLLVCSSHDPRCPERADRFYADLHLDTVLLPDSAGHVNEAGGYGRWDGMAEMLLEEGHDSSGFKEGKMNVNLLNSHQPLP